MPSSQIKLHKGDLPAGLSLGPVVAIDTETLGLKPSRDRLVPRATVRRHGRCASGSVRRPRLVGTAPQGAAGRSRTTKIFHFARFDLAVLEKYLGVMTSPVWCTKIASKLARTYTDRHGLKDLCGELLGIDLSKQQQSSDWAAFNLSQQQQAYAASDVLHLHELKNRLEAMLTRDGRKAAAEACFRFLPDRVRLDLTGFEEVDIFAH